MKNDIKTVIEIGKQIIYIMNRKQKKQAVMLFFVIIIGAMFETLSVSAVIPFMQAILTPLELGEKWYWAFFIRTFHLQTEYSIIIMVGILIIAVYVIKNGYLTFSTYAQVRYKSQFQKNLSTKMLDSYMKRPYSYFLDVNSAQVLRGIHDDVGGVYTVLDSLLRILMEMVTVSLIGVFIIVTDPFMAVGVILLATFTLLLIISGVKRQLKVMGLKHREASTGQYKCAYQAINGIKEIKVMRREQNFLKQYRTVYETKMKAEVRFNFLSAIPERIIETICVAGLIAVVCVRIGFMDDIAAFVPKLGAFAIAAFRILPSISKITGSVNALVFYRPSLEATYRNLQEVKQYENIIDDSNEKVEAKLCPHFDKHITVESISWRYNNTAENVISGLDLTVKKGESIAFIGASGAGKTTLADIILGLLKPQTGSIKMDDTDISTIPEQWAKTIGYVPQTVFLTDDTIRNNVAFGIEENMIDEEAVWRALEMAQIKDFVEKLSKGLDTEVGERGIKFSGGQRQRVAVARALYYDPDILVLDEATSALDGETEAAVMESIDSLQKHKTLIIIAHRLTTIKNCDKVYEIADGRAIRVEKAL